ncbi:MAG: 2-amino-4-hydroxy-6-hydroxymethyldihydropteridine diphosphokinase [Anaerolineales bacterium]|jgi:2-amino-4-hydroxy-6-hydroxymethyldihydropteridine diphosphokinase|nr:2-amino-4-hydroxy-6-hydroxymethyldihydropteridine diphosphokinase [Chloroflexota bacterium]MBK6644329.1 2-amino-4-hydroxy-6-hydroxymethyldihydropteridine diphosphokinase [Anaerolineales bacterium]MCC6986928.1 2-amino-4-hydroxy-6-hydroxymethyldihydropteridine diphosphokinase [Anaerolineales bacterium]
MMDHTVYLALGSNLGNRLANLKNAISNLTPQMDVKKKSPVYETPPWGYADQPPFLNQCVMAETYLDPENLLSHLKRLETVLGREPTFENGPRLIDIDILLYADEIIDSPPLVVPHPRMHTRGFVLVPLNDIAPDLVHPVLGKPVSELLLDVERVNIHEYKGK